MATNDPSLDRLRDALLNAGQPQKKPEDQGVTASDFGRQLLGGGAQAAGYGVRGALEPIAAPARQGRVSARNQLVNVEPLINTANQIAAKGDQIQQGVSPAAKQAMADSTPEGNLLEPSTWSLGKNPSLKGYGLQAASVLGQVVPTIATALATKGKLLPTAAVAGSMGGGAAGQQEQQRIEQMDQGDLDKVPAYQRLIQAGQTPASARQALAESSGSHAALTTMPVSALGAFTEGLPVTEVGQNALARIVGSSKLARATTGVALEALGEGAQEAGEQAAQTYGANQATGEQRSLGEDTFQNALLGAIGAVGPGVAGAVLHGGHGAHVDESTQTQTTAQPGAPAETAATIDNAPPAGEAAVPVSPDASAATADTASAAPPIQPLASTPAFTPSQDPVTQAVNVAPGVTVHANDGPLSKSLVEGAKQGAMDRPAVTALSDGSTVNTDTGELLTPPTAQVGENTTNAKEQAQNSASVPFMITAAQRRDLTARGYDRQAIAKMKPAEAQSILATPAPSNAVPAADEKISHDDLDSIVAGYYHTFGVLDAQTTAQIARRFNISRQDVSDAKKRVAKAQADAGQTQASLDLGQRAPSPTQETTREEVSSPEEGGGQSAAEVSPQPAENGPEQGHAGGEGQAAEQPTAAASHEPSGSEGAHPAPEPGAGSGSEPATLERTGRDSGDAAAGDGEAGRRRGEPDAGSAVAPGPAEASAEPSDRAPAPERPGPVQLTDKAAETAAPGKWFGTADKAAAYITKQGLGDSHEVVQADRRFEVRPKATEGNAHADTAQPAPQAGAVSDTAGAVQGPDHNAPAPGSTTTAEPATAAAPAATQLTGKALSDQVTNVNQSMKDNAAYSAKLPGRQAKGIPAAEIHVSQAPDGQFHFAQGFNTGTTGASHSFSNGERMWSPGFKTAAEARAGALNELEQRLPKKGKGTVEAGQIKRIKEWLASERAKLTTPPEKTHARVSESVQQPVGSSAPDQQTRSGTREAQQGKAAPVAPGAKPSRATAAELTDAATTPEAIKVANQSKSKMWNGQPIEYTGRTVQEDGSTHYEATFTGGKNKGETVLIPRSIFEGDLFGGHMARDGITGHEEPLWWANATPEERLKLIKADQWSSGLLKGTENWNDVLWNDQVSLTRKYGKADEAPKGALATKIATREAAPAKPRTPHGTVADYVQQRLEKKQAITPMALAKAANEAFGGTMAEGKYSIKDAYDAMEQGVNQWIMAHPEFSPTLDAKGAVKAIDKLAAITKDVLPTQTKRTPEMEEFQQFSTHPAFAYLANWVANLSSADTVLEPSAGTGGLAAFAKLATNDIHTNELSERRAGILRELGFANTTTENAEQINNILPREVQPSVVVMNPPFSATAGRLQGQRKTVNAAAHIEQALGRLEPGGRLVAIVGNGMAADKPAFRQWWDKIKSQYDVRANLGLPGKEYAKYGTNFDNNLLVIDKNGPTTTEPVTGTVAKLTDAVPLLEDIRGREGNERVETAQQLAGVGESQVDSAASAATGTGRQPAPADVAGVGDQQPEAGRDVPGEGANGVRPSEREAAAGAGAAGVRPVDRTARRGSADQRVVAERSDAGSGSGEDGAGSGQSGGVVIRTGNFTEQPQTIVGQVNANSSFEGYKPQRLEIPGAKPHPGALVQSSAMAAVEPPLPTYTPNLPREVITKGKLSDAQLESVVYAGQAHAQRNADGSRKGYFIGDGTGVGKGREIAGVIMDNQRQGRKKAVWISEKSGLLDDAKRDFAGIGGDPNQLAFQGKTKAGDKLDPADGIAFTTYATLRSAESKSAVKGGASPKTRIDQLVEWLGKDFDGVIAFDEAHNMGNAVAMKGKRGKTDPSAQALAGLALQDALPHARMVYVSATGATEVANLSYAKRLGLWGPGTAFPTVENFINSIHSGGLAAMELVSRDMKQMGVYMARGLSYDGVAYDRVEHALTPDQHEVYNELAKAWQGVLRNVNEALQLTSAAKNGNAKSAALSAFWSTQQRFFNQVLTSMQMPSGIEAMRKDLAEGRSVVGQLVNTSEAALNRALAGLGEDANLEDLDLTPRDALMQYVRNSFPTQQFEEYTDENGNIGSRAVMDSKGEPVFNQEAIKAREQLLQNLADIRVPDGPLEMILNAFGADNVAEITGRKTRVVYERQEDGSLKRVQERRSQSAVKADAADFQAGKKRVLVFSDAGGTGYSFHSDLGAKNQQQRAHYLVQPGWRADKAVQGFGRTHRSNEANQPIYKLLTTDLPAQKRFMSSIARRLDQLGALTKGQRDANSQGLLGEKDNLESPYAQDAIENLFRDMYANRVPDMPFKQTTQLLGFDSLTDKDGALNQSKIPSVPQFLNRLLSLPTDMQGTVFDAFTSRMDARVQAAINAGTLDTGMQTIQALSTKLVHEQPVYTDPATGATTNYVQLELTQPTKLQRFPDTGLGKWQFVKNEASGRVWVVKDAGSLTDDSGKIIPRVTMYNPTSTRVENKATLGDKFTVISEDEARALWQNETDAAPKTYTEPAHMVTGALLPIWDRLKGHVRVARVLTEDGQRYLGRQINQRDLASTLKALGANAAESRMAPADLQKAIIHDGKPMELANGWILEKKRVGSEDRIEITRFPSYDYAQQRELQRVGGYIEKIQWQNRAFLPTGAEGVKALEALTARNPVVGSVDSGNQGVDFSKASSAPSAAATPLRPADFAAINDAVAGQVSKWVNAPVVRVVPNEASLPAYIRNDANFDPSVEAAHDRGAIYLVADRLGSIARAQEVLAHEAIGHYSVEQILGRQGFQQVRNGIVNLRDSGAMKPVFDEVTRRYGLLDDNTLAAETLAVMAEKGIKSTLLGRMVASMREFLRKLGFVQSYTENDLRGLIQRAGAWLETGRAQPLVSVRDQVDYSGSDIRYADPAENHYAYEDAWTPTPEQRAGNLLDAQRQWEAKGTQSPYFKAWFGDSKAKAKNGNPAKLYHGTDYNFGAFDPRRGGASTFSPMAGLGIFTTSDRAMAENYGERVMQLYMRAEKPYTLKGAELETLANGSMGDGARLRAELKAKGYDSAWIPSMNTLVAFDPEQLKSATSNRGTFDRTTSQLNFSKRDPQELSDQIDRAASWRISDLTDFLKNKREDWRPSWLGMLTLRQLAEVSSEYLPRVQQYADLVQAMQTRRTMLQDEAFGVADKWNSWQRKNREESKTLTDVMHDATLAGVDPAEDFRAGSVTLQSGEAVSSDARGLERARQLDDEAVSAEPAAARILKEDAARIRQAVGVEQTRREAYPELQQRFAQLSPDAQAIYKTVRDAYAARAEAMQNALIDRIGGLEMDATERKALADRVRAHFESARVQSPYFPLARFGEYWVSAEKNGEKEFRMMESRAAQKRVQEAYKKDGWTTKAGAKIDMTRAIDGASANFMANVADTLAKHGVDEDVADEVYQLYLRTLPDLSVRKQFIHRKGVAGYDQDALRAFAAHMNHGSYQLARLETTHQMERVLRGLRTDANALSTEGGEDAVKAARVISEVDKRHAWVMNPKDAAWVQRVSAANFAYYLGATPAAAVVNLTQGAITTFPALASRYGWAKAAGEMFKALKQSISTYGHTDKVLTGDELRAHHELVNMGAIDRTQAHQLAGMGEGSMLAYNPAWRTTMTVLSHGFHKAEVFNRESAGLAAYRLARAAGESHDAAVQYAAETIFQTHFDYSNANRARFMQGNAAKVLFAMKQYSQHMSYWLWRNLYQSIKGATPQQKSEARRKLVGTLGMTAVFSGVMGLPLMSLMFGVANGFHAAFGDDDEPWDAETEFRNFLTQMLGPAFGHVAAVGPVEAATGLGIADRTKLNDMWFRSSDQELEGRAQYDYWLEQIAGPVGGMFANAANAAKLYNDGYLWRGVETAMPKVVKDGLKAIRYEREGVNTLRGDPLVQNLSPYQMLMQAAGFSPAQVNAQYEVNNALTSYQKALTDRRKALMDAYAMGVRMRDQSMTDATYEKIKHFNTVNPEIAITAGQIRRSLIAREKYDEQAVNGIVLNKKTAAKVKARVDFQGEGD